MHPIAHLIADAFLAMPPIARVILVLGLVSAAGLALGNIKIRGVGLGIGGVLFAGLAGGHLAKEAGVHFNTEMMDFIRDFGLVLFVYTIGIQVGPGFFATLKRQGLALNALALVAVLGSMAVAALLDVTGVLPLGAALGVFAGGVTNAPALAATQQVLAEVHADALTLALPGLAFAVTYPFGIAGNLLAMGLVRLGFRINPQDEAAAFDAQRRAEAALVDTLNVTVTNPGVEGVRLGDLHMLAQMGVVASRLLRDGRLEVAAPGVALRCGDVLHLVGPRPRLEEVSRLLGAESAAVMTTKGTDVRWERIVVTAGTVLGKPIATVVAAIEARTAQAIVISRVTRAGVELVPDAALKLQFGDILTIIGHPPDVAVAAGVIGNSARRLQQVELVPVFLGMALGAIVGSIPLFLPGMPAPLRLGLAGGPLIVAILLGRLGHLGPLVWFMPPAANLVLREIGIVLFLAVLGVASGDRFVETLASGAGWPWMAWGVLVTLVPLLVTGVLARAVFRLNFLSICGLLAGAQTNPPGLSYANAVASSEAPALAYATVYPLSMCLRILAPQVMVLLLT